MPAVTTTKAVTTAPKHAEWYAKLDAQVGVLADEAAAYMDNREPASIRAAIVKAYEFARKAHEGQERLSGEPYITHPVGAAMELMAIKPDLVTIQACLLHDVPEDTAYDNDDIAKVFGTEVAFITQGMEKIGKIKYRGQERQIQNMRKTFVYMAKDPRLILVKFADRIHNLKTLGHHPDPEKRKRIALETLEIYSPIADRLGVYSMRETLENESFKHMLPEEHDKIVAEMGQMSAERDRFMKEAEAKIRAAVADPEIPVTIEYRVKAPYSVYKKMQRKGYRHVQDLPDIFAIRLVTDTVPHCYALLSMVHARWQPIFLRFKDYIGQQKENGYQSLHTTVVGMFPFRVEVQIRTKQMHEQAEIGIAAHFTYAETGRSLESHHEAWIQHLRDALNQEKDADFMSHVRSTVLGDNISVFTPKGQTVILPVDATPIDFAYAIHSDIGDRAYMARVDNRVVPVSTELASGNVIEIITDKNAHPQEFWLTFVKTPKAKQCIKAYLLKNHRPQLIERGREILESYLLKNVGHRLDKNLSLLNNVDGKVNAWKDKEEILIQIGNLTRKPTSLFRSLELDPETKRKLDDEQRKRSKEADANRTAKRARKEKAAASDPARKADTARHIVIGGQKSIPYQIARCCEPEGKRNIVGVVRRDGTVRVHAAHCHTLNKTNPQRIVPAFWEFIKTADSVITARFTFTQSTTALARIIGILEDMGVAIHETSMRRLGAGEAQLDITFEVHEDNQYVFDHVVERVRHEVPEYKDSKLIDIR